jgi:hypothetical protein
LARELNGGSPVDNFMDVCRTANVAVYLDEQNVDGAETNGMTLFDLSTMMALHLRQSRVAHWLGGFAAERFVMPVSITFGRVEVGAAALESIADQTDCLITIGACAVAMAETRASNRLPRPRYLAEDASSCHSSVQKRECLQRDRAASQARVP